MLIPAHIALLHVSTAAFGIGLYALVTHVGHQRRPPAAAIGWVLAMTGFPYVGIPLFLLLGTRKLATRRRRRLRAIESHSPLAPGWSASLSRALALPPARPCSRIEVLDDGPAALAALVGLVERAQASVDVCTYVLADDAAGRAVGDALVAAVRRGVRVRMLLDYLGSRWQARALPGRLRRAGVDVRWFVPLLHSPWRGRTNLRNHRKLAIADGRVLWSGGRNLGAHYFAAPHAPGGWIDLGYLVEGRVAQDAADTFEHDWFLSTGRRPRPGPALSGPGADAGPLVQFIASGPDHAADTLQVFLLTAIFQARARVLVATPYFVPDDALAQALLIACMRGVQVTVLVPARSNHALADVARGRPLRDLLAAGARVHASARMLHAKLVVADDALALCGSMNIDPRSLFLNFECATAFYGADEVGRFAAWFDRQLGDATPYPAAAPGWLRELGEGVVRAVAFQL